MYCQSDLAREQREYEKPGKTFSLHADAGRGPPHLERLGADRVIQQRLDAAHYMRDIRQIGFVADGFGDRAQRHAALRMCIASVSY